MKKFLLSILSIGLFTATYAQDQQGGGLGLEFGLRGAPASSWLFNQNVSNAGESQNYAAAFSYNYGLDFAFDISGKCAIEVDLLLGTLTQGYNGKFSNAGFYVNTPVAFPDNTYANGESYTSKNTLKTMDIPLLFRFGSGNGAYIEIGPQYDIVQGATYTASYTGQNPGTASSANYSTAGEFGTSNIEGVLGFGDDFQIGASGFNIITNLRFSYGFTDLVGADGLGQGLEKSPGGSDNVLYSGSNPYYAGYKPTHSATVSFSIGVYYYIGLVQSKGGRHACKHTPKAKG
jgi:hypothetical protein